MKLLHITLYGLVMSSLLHSEEIITLNEDKNITKSVKKNSFKFALELGAKQNFWRPGLSKDEGQYLLNYDTEGINAGYGKLKGKLYNTDVFELEAYQPLTSSSNQDTIIEEHKKDNKSNYSIDGVRLFVHASKLLDHLLDTNTFGNFDFEYDSRNFTGIGTLNQNSFYWFGRNTGNIDTDFMPVERGVDISFKTKFETYKLFYTIDKFVGDSYVSLGVFDTTWSKPTFTQVRVLQEVPVFFHANYHAQGLSLHVGNESKNYDFRAYLDYGVNNDMKLTSELSASDLLEQDEKLNMMIYGAKLDYKLYNLYTSHRVAFDLIVGGYGEFSKIGRNYIGQELDAEFNYGYHLGIEATF